MTILVDVFLPLGLAVIMFSLGLGLSPADFTRAFRHPQAFLAGAVAQLVVVPAVAFTLLQIVTLDPVLAVGVMILSFCPGGPTSNMLTRFAGGDVALSVTLTAVMSLVSVATMPPLVALAAVHFLGIDAPRISVGALAITMLLITALPVALGLTVRHFAPVRAKRIEPTALRAATGVFALIVVAAIAANWEILVREVGRLGPLIAALIGILLFLGFAIARAAGLDQAQSRTVSIETGIQNGTLGITVGGLVAGAAGASSGFVVPSAVYGILMYAISVPAILLIFRRAGGRVSRR